MNTKQKVALASGMSSVARALRRFGGQPDHGIFTRGKIKWDLDLKQGIDFAIYLQGAFEPGTIRDYRRVIKPGSFALDIGANIGAHTLPIAEIVGDRGRVIAFEPTDYAFAKLQKNLALNPSLAERVVPVQAVLLAGNEAEKPDAIPSSWSLESSPGQGEVHPVHGGTFQTLVGARSVTLDDWFDENPTERLDFAKIDVDGYEIGVIQGGMKTFEKWKPVLMMEFAPYIFAERGRSFGELLDLLNSLNYKCRSISGKAIDLEPGLADTIADGGSINVILDPK